MGEYRKVLVLYVGGTIGMQRNEKGVYIPVEGKFLEKVKFHSEMHDAELARKYFRPLKCNELMLPSTGPYSIIYELVEYSPLLDSSNVSCKEWIRIALDIEENYRKYDGFVVLHGTDTLAYTSSILSFMLEGIQKPVIITGSQIPIFETRSDAKENFLSSLIVAGSYNIPEVCVFFASKLFRGNRTAKVSSNLLDAFDSPNYHPLANVGINVKVHDLYIKKETDGPFKVHTSLNCNVGMITIFPTITSDMLEAFLKAPLKGTVLQSYGAGNIPSNRQDVIEVLKKAVHRKIIIINVTQCTKGTVSPSYETGKTLEDAGVISGQDMTAEAALTKLVYVLGIPGMSYKARVELMKTNLRGEMTCM